MTIIVKQRRTTQHRGQRSRGRTVVDRLSRRRIFAVDAGGGGGGALPWLVNRTHTTTIVAGVA